VLALAAETARTTRLRYRGHEADPFAEPERLTLAEARAGRIPGGAAARARGCARPGRS
jgi:hypothetical protein